MLGLLVKYTSKIYLALELIKVPNSLVGQFLFTRKLFTHGG